MVFLLLAAGGCRPDEADTEMEMNDVVRDPTQVSDAERVNVTLNDFVIEMPDTLDSGMIAFVATNRGTHDHNLEVENGGIHHRIPADLRPGETNELLVALAPGTYRAYCPVDDHAEQGMEKQIVVR